MTSTSSDSKNSAKDKQIADARPRRTGIGGILEPAVLTWRLFWDSRIDALPKLIPLGAIAYLISPVDFLPELALGPLGVVDDVGLLLIALNAFIAICPPDIVADLRQRIVSGSGASQDADVVEGTATSPDDPPMD